MYVKVNKKPYTEKINLIVIIVTSILSLIGFIASILSLLDSFGIIDINLL